VSTPAIPVRKPAPHVVLLAAALTDLLCLMVGGPGRYWANVATFVDMRAYERVTTAIRDWHLAVAQPHQFWGYPYVAALTAGVLAISPAVALTVVAVVASATATVLVYRLWGGWVALYFACVSWAWTQRAVFGGSEPLFLALLLTAFALARKERWVWATAVASLATTVRPFGVLVLGAILCTLIRRRAWRTLGWSAVTVASVVIAYAVPLWLAFGDPLANVHSYQQTNWPRGIPVGAPFMELWRDAHAMTRSSLRLALNVLALALLLLALFDRVARWKSTEKIESTFVIGYAVFLLCLNVPGYALFDFPRYVIPLLPFAIVAIERWLPRQPVVAIVCACLAGPIAGAAQERPGSPIRALVHWMPR
jgi:hypothetical protein